ncbi:MAG: flagellar biosynthesis protein FlhB [Rhodobacteraceae bacterium]|jgi:flagellar biosynthetic protein FlhB|nr:flagellar biosynthesis protein FlhB [Paracoccaceae bacterium]
MSEDQAAEKEHEPTQGKLDEARRKGDIPKSTDLTTAAAYLGFAVMALALGGEGLVRLGTALSAFLDRPDAFAGVLSGHGGRTVLRGPILQGLALLAPWFALPMIAALLALVAQRALVFSGDKLAFKASRIDPLANAGQKFGRTGLFEFAKSFVKLVLISVLLAVFLWGKLPRILQAQRLEPALIAAEIARMVTEFVVLVTVVTLVIGGVDYVWQRAEHLRRNRMSRQELLDEMKQSEGDPHMKAQRRQRGVDIAMNRMLSDVQGADVIIVNPTHYAVALKWDRGSGRAPVCVAKGVDEVAATIRRIGMEHGVPIRSDPPTARALHATLEIGDEIRPEHYKPIAAAIRFAEAMRKRARGKWGP